ncbi:MAG TPA: hypothetical protein VIL18_13730 [Longimicrobiales bacterium]
MTSRQSSRWIAAVLAACALASAPAPGAGQQIRSPYRFLEQTQAGGLFVGYLGTDRGRFDLGPGPGPLLGGRYGIRLSGPFTIEGEAAFLPTSRFVIGLDQDTIAPDSIVSRPVRLGRESDQSLLLLLAGLRFNLTGPRTYRNLQPYLLAGGGAVIELSDEDRGTDLPSDARFDFGTSFAGHLGGGVEWFAMRRLGLRLDGRLVFWEIDLPRAFQTEVPRAPDDEWVQHFYVSAGAAIHF